MTDIPQAPVIDHIITESSLDRILRSVMREMVDVDMVARMVNTAVDSRMQGVQNMVNTIDRAQQTSYIQFEQTARDLRASNESVQKTMLQISNSLSGLQTGRDDDRKRISDMFRRVETHDDELEKLRAEIAQIKNEQGEIHIDIHGDPNQALRPSIRGLLTELDSKLDTGLREIKTEFVDIKKKQAEHDRYITKQQQFINIVWGSVKNIWEKKLYRYIIATAIGGALLGAFAGSPGGIDLIEHIIKLLAGK